MIKIFNSNDKSYTTNGNIAIQPIKCIETKYEGFKGWEVEVEATLDFKDFIAHDNIIVVPTKSRGEQPFRIQNPEITQRAIKFRAIHVAFDTSRYLINDIYPQSLNGSALLDWINTRTDRQSPFTTTSDVSNLGTARIIRKTLQEAFLIAQERVGGFFDFDKWGINLLSSIGLDRGETIRYGKNLQGIRVYENWSNVCTKILPIGPNGITLPEVYLFSDRQYDEVYAKAIPFEIQAEEGEELSDEEMISKLRTLGEEYIEKNKYPEIHYEIQADVNQTLDIGDTVYTVTKQIEVPTRVQGYVYDVNKKRVTKLVYGNFNRDVKRIFNTIREDINHAIESSSAANKLIQEQSSLINQLGKLGHVYQDENEIMILDNLPKETAQNVLRINLGGIGFSSTGIEGPWISAWTLDGKFNASFIQTGILNASLLKAGMIQSPDGLSYWNLDSGEIVLNVQSLKINAKSVATEEDIQNIELTPGPEGQSAYEAAVANGFTGTIQEWLASLEGPQGPQGLQGLQGDKGDQGIQGPTGPTLYTWVKYADTPTSGMSNFPDGKTYMGIAYNKTTATESSTYADYTWSLIKGAQGDQGIQGPSGPQGNPTYTWIKYADTVTGSGMSDSPTGKRFLGLAHNKTTATESTNPGDYNWSPLYDNVQVGGRNLILNGDFSMESSGWSALPDIQDDNGLLFVSQSYGWGVTQAGINMTEDNTYIFSALIRGVGDVSARISLRPLDANGTQIASHSLYSSFTSEWKQTSFGPYTPPAGTKSLRVYFLCSSSEGTVDFAKIKLEKGNIATDWTPAPEDIDSKFSEHWTQIDQNKKDITFRAIATEVEGKIWKQASAPAHEVGRLWLETDKTPNILYRSTGSAWVKVTPTNAAEVGAYSSADGGSLAIRVTSAEQKITPEAIVNTFTTQFETDENATIEKGIVTLSKDGVNVGTSESEINSQLAHDGLSVRDGDSTIANFGELGAVVPTIESNVHNLVSNTGTHTVGVGKTYSSLSNALDSLFGGKKKIHVGADVILDVFSNISETVEISGLVGTGRLIIRFNNCTFNGNFEIFGNKMPIYIVNGSPGTAVIKNPTNISGYMFNVGSSDYVHVSGLNLDNNGGYYLCRITYGSSLHFESCDAVRYNYMCDINNASDVTIVNCKGNASSGVLRIREGGKAYLSGSIPAGGAVDYSTNKFVFNDGTVSRIASSYSPPPVTNETFTQVFSSATFDTLVHGTTSVDSYYGSTATQNRWDSSMGWKDGRVRLSSAIYNFFNGGANISIRYRLRRKNSTHGSSLAVKPAPYNHSASFSTGATRGGWTLTFYNGVQGTSGYAIWDAIEVEVTVTKQV